MKISIIDKGAGIAREFGKAIGARVEGRFLYIPESKGAGYITGFSWGQELRMMIRNYHLKEEVYIERTNELAEGQDDMVFLLSGIFPSADAFSRSSRQLSTEQASILICPHAVSSVLNMPPDTIFGSVTIAVAKSHLRESFGHIDHPIVKSILEAGTNFIIEASVTAPMIDVAGEMLAQPVPEDLASHYYKLKCEELLCLICSELMRREELPATRMHIDDIKAIYAIKARLQTHLDRQPEIAQLASQAGMSQPRLRKLFKQTFGKGIFEYYQSARMQDAARLLKEKRLTVSEVGYTLGFSNLSHFARIFKQHFGMLPKKYSTT